MHNVLLNPALIMDSLNKVLAFFSFILSHNTSSPQWALNKKDLLKGLAVAAFTPILTIIYQSVIQPVFDAIVAGQSVNMHWVIDWRTMLMTAVIAIGAYLQKNFVSTPPK